MSAIIGDQTANEVFIAAQTSYGTELPEMDVINIKKFTLKIKMLVNLRTNQERFLNDRMTCVAPNLTALIGDKVGAKMISQAGSLTNLAKYPASTIQILGAEKALFRALKTKSATPK